MYSTGPVHEDLVLDPRGPVLPDVARLGGKDDRGVALPRQQNVGVTVHDHEARQVGDRALEAAVLGAAHEHRVQLLLCHRLPDEPVAAVDFLVTHHDCSNPFTSDQMARFNGVGTPCSSPKRTMPPFK